MKKCRLNVLLISSAFSYVIIATSCKEEQKTKEVKAVKVEFKREGELQIIKADTDSIIQNLEIEIADNDYERQTGLMYRNSMKDSEAMFFIFPEATYQTFYMRNTEIPLDIIFINENKEIINIHKNARPMQETSLPSEAPAQYVLEINAGLSDRWSLQKGDRIKYN